MSVLRNTIANYLGQAYTSMIGIVILPLFLRHLGPEGYGLIGFFTLLQSWLQLLDFGMTPTLAREVARLKGDESERGRLVTVANSLESVFMVVALAVGACIFLGRGWIASRWLSFQTLDVATVTTALGTIAVVVATRWVSSLNRSGVNAYEAQVWMSLSDIMLYTLRFPCSLLLIMWRGDVLLYFYYQMALAVLELFWIRAKFRRLLPQDVVKARRFSLCELRPLAPFALGLGYTTAIWVLLTQLDKLLLSKVLPLSEYGYFTLVATICSGLLLVSAPVSKAILPRMTALLARGSEREMLALYCRSTRFVACLVTPVTVLLTIFPSEIVYLWTGSREAALWVKPVLPLFVLGNGLLAVGAFQYYLQYAHGKLRQHVIYNTASLAVSTPLVVYTAFRYGPVGVAYVWLVFRAVSLLLWTPYIHHLLAPGLHLRWFLRDVLTPAAAGTAFILAVVRLAPGDVMNAGRLQGFFFVSILALAAMAVAALVSNIDDVKERLQHFHANV